MESDRIPFIVGDNPVHLLWRFLKGRRHQWLIGRAGGLFMPQTPTSQLFGLKLSVFDFSTEGKCKIRRRELFCSTAGNKLLFHILIPLANVQKAFVFFAFQQGIFVIIGGFLIALFIFAYLYHVTFFNSIHSR